MVPRTILYIIDSQGYYITQRHWQTIMGNHSFLLMGLKAKTGTDDFMVIHIFQEKQEKERIPGERAAAL